MIHKKIWNFLKCVFTQSIYLNCLIQTYLFARFEDIAFKCITATVPSNVTKNFQVVAIMGDIEYPVTNKEKEIAWITFYLLFSNFF